MWPLKSKKKKQQQIDDDFWTKAPYRLKVRRLTPSHFRGVHIKGYIPGGYNDIMSMDDVLHRVSEQHGGGDFTIEIYKGADYLRSVNIAIAGDPLNNGEPFAEVEKKSKEEDPQEPEKVREFREKTEIAKAEAAYRQTLKEAGINPEGQIDPRDEEIQELRGELAQLHDRNSKEEESAVEREERRHREAMEANRAQSNQMMQMFTSMITALVGNKGDDKTFDMMKAITDANTKQIDCTMKQMEANRLAQEASQAKMLDLVMSKSDAMMQMFMEQINNKGNSAEEQMAFFSKALSTALQFAEGKMAGGEEEAAQSWPGLVDRLSTKLFETVQHALELKGQQTEFSQDQFKSAVKDAVKNVVEETRAAPSLPAPATDATPPTKPAVVAKSPPPAAKPPVPRVQPTKQPQQLDPKKGMDMLLKLFLEDATSGRADPWARVQHYAPKLLPGPVLIELGKARSQTGEAFAAVIRKYASEKLAEKALHVAAELSQAKTEPPAETPPPKVPVQPRQRPAARTRRSRAKGSMADAAAEGAAKQPPAKKDDDKAGK